ncbi:O-antigen ligase family protein [Clostridium perfringens]|uniref:O-antigen ligase family protein n=1 Tax=Clostridium perfringens TaxID=1502 RepID=UPI001F065122|nr:O-antigen ligase family protein [Clostridium perfringens]
MKKNKSILITIDSISLILMLVGEICFFKSETIYIYWILTGCGMVMAILNNINRFSFKFKKDNFVLWLSLMYSMYFFYGLFYLQMGEFPIDTLLYRFVEGIVLYLLLSSLLEKDTELLVKSFAISGVISILYLISSEKTNILMGGSRIGDSLSGNVNTVGFNFGIISTVLMWSICKEKKFYKVLVFVLLSIFMLLTGSKKTLIIFIVDILIFFVYKRKKISGWIKIIIMLIVGSYIIFNIPYFYDIIGSRIESMFDTLIFGNNTRLYSYSTEVRDDMIIEAFHLFLNKPIFGGGWNYFYSKTIYGYEYSHCNYTEMLCSFGIVGTMLYYGKYFSNIKTVLKYRKKNFDQNIDFIIIVIAFSIEALVLDWGAVSFSAQIVWYIPIIFSSAVIYVIRKNNYVMRIKNGENKYN